MYHIKTGWAPLFTCAVSVSLPFWKCCCCVRGSGFHVRSSMWWWDSTCMNRKLSEFLFWIRDYCAVGWLQAHYAVLALFTWNLDRARGTKTTVALRYIYIFFHGTLRPKCGRHGCHEIPTLVVMTDLCPLWSCLHFPLYSHCCVSWVCNFYFLFSKKYGLLICIISVCCFVMLCDFP